MKHIPKPTFTPHKGVFDDMGPLTKKTPKPAPLKEEEPDQEEGLTFTVHHEGPALQQNLMNFFTKKTIIEAGNTDETALKLKMSRID